MILLEELLQYYSIYTREKVLIFIFPVGQYVLIIISL